jgi:transposase-like protein
MADFKCDGCGSTRTLNKTTTVLRGDKWVVKEAECFCEKDKYMEQIMTDEYKGIPNLKRTENSLTKKNK